MAGGKETPRQKMIGMMYLVLTALLALNVSKEILDAFVIINEGLESSKVTFKQKIDDQYMKFEASYTENPQKYKKNWDKAKEVREKANEITDQVDRMKAYIIGKVEGKPEDQVIAGNGRGQDTVLSLQYVQMKDNYDISTEVLVGENAGIPRESHPDGDYLAASNLKNNLASFRDRLIELLEGQSPVLEANFQKTFDFSDRRDASGTMSNWEGMNFYYIPLAAVITNLSKIQTDVRNVEADMVSWLMADVDAASYKFTKLAPIAIPKSNYVLQGDTFRADVFLAAYDDTNFPSVIIAADESVEHDSTNVSLTGEGVEVPIGDDGFAKLRIPADQIGFRNWKGVIKFKGPKGEQPFLFDVSYEVAKPSLVVSPTKMNVFYRGLENPIDISVPGFSAEKIKPSVSNGTLGRNAEGWFVKPGSGTECVISVSVEMDDGSAKPMGNMTFRCKNVPKPIPVFAGLTIGDTRIEKSKATAQIGVGAKMDDFVFDLQYPVVSFDVSTTLRGEMITQSSNSNRLTDKQKEMLRNVTRNQKIYIENIKAKAPDGTINPIGNLAFTVY